MKKTTIKDIARRLNLNHATVSRVLKNGTGFSEETKKRVLATAKELNYTPNWAAQALVSGKTMNIAVVISAWFGVFVMESLRGMEDSIDGTGYSLTPVSTSRYRMEGSDATGMQAFMNILSQNKADAVIAETVFVNNAIAQEFNKAAIPLILLDPAEEEGTRIKSAGRVEFDNFLAGLMAAERLVFSGVKNPAYVGASSRWVNSQRDRLAGFKKGLADAGVKLREDSVYEYLEYTQKTEQEIAAKICGNEHDGVFCAAGEWMSVAIMAKAYSMSIMVPERLKIITVDDSGRIAESLGLTAIRQPVYQMASTALKMAVEAAKTGEIIKPNVIFKPEIIVRKTA